MHYRTALRSDAPVPLSSVLEWARSPQLRAQAVVYHLLSAHPNRITPPAMENITGFRLRYLEACVHADWGRSALVHGRWGAVIEALGWFECTWQEHRGQKNDRTAQEILVGIRDLLARQYLTGDAKIREAIMLGFLEHAFQAPAIAAFFAEWQSHPQLRLAYSEAMELVEGWYQLSDTTLRHRRSK